MPGVLFHRKSRLLPAGKGRGEERGAASWVGTSPATHNPQPHDDLVWWCGDLLSLQIWQGFCRRTPLDTDIFVLEEQLPGAGEVVGKDSPSRTLSLLRTPAALPWAAPLPARLMQVLTVGCGGCFCCAGCVCGIWVGRARDRWGFHAEAACLLFPKCPWGVSTLSCLPSGFGVKTKNSENKRNSWWWQRRLRC